ncbi:MAG: DUF6923 family protein [Rhodanobacteraceae bacterium]
MRTLACLTAAGMLVFSASGARAETIAYGEAFDTLYRFGLDTHVAVEVGPAGSFGGQLIGNISGLSFSNDEELYAVAGGMNALTRIDPTSGSASVVGTLGLAGQGDPQRNDALDLNMTFGCDDTLWLVSAFAGKLWKVNPANGATTLVGATGHTITGLVARGNAMYGAGAKGDNTLYRINTQTGEARPIGSYGPDASGWINSVSMSFDDAGTLWAVLNYVPPAEGSVFVPDWSDLATIDPNTGEVTVIGPIVGPEEMRQVGMKGFAIGPPRCVAGATPVANAPVGTPPWLLVLGLVLAVSAGAAMRRRETR